jgi:PDZ domain
MNNRWMLGIAMMLGSAITCAEPPSTTPQMLYDVRIIVSVDGVKTSTARMVGFPGVPYHVSAVLGPDANDSPRMRIDATATQQASADSAVTIKLTLSKPDSKGEMQVFATPVVAAAEGQISYVQVGDITLSVWVMRTHTPSAADRTAAALATVPTVIYANDEVVQPSCASPGSLEPPAPRSHGGDRIVFRRGTDLHVGIATLEQTYSLSVHFPAKNWDVSSDGVFVPPLTQAQIAQLRCDPVVERIVLAPRTPESLAQEPPPPGVRLGIVYDYDPLGQSKPLIGGALVARVESGSVAERAGLLPGDKVVRFGDHDIRGADLQTIMATKKPGDTVTMEVIRNGVEMQLVAQF